MIIIEIILAIILVPTVILMWYLHAYNEQYLEYWHKQKGGDSIK